MKVKYDTEIIDSQNYITGYYSCSDPDAVELDPQFYGNVIWRDENGNPVWQLNEDGSISSVSIPLSSDQQSLKDANSTIISSQQSISDLIPQILDCLVNGSPIPQTLIDSWNNARSSITAATATITTIKSLRS